jgi:hypothetical protein
VLLYFEYYLVPCAIAMFVSFLVVLVKLWYKVGITNSHIRLL